MALFTVLGSLAAPGQQAATALSSTVMAMATFSVNRETELYPVEVLPSAMVALPAAGKPMVMESLPAKAKQDIWGTPRREDNAKEICRTAEKGKQKIHFHLEPDPMQQDTSATSDLALDFLKDFAHQLGRRDIALPPVSGRLCAHTQRPE